MTTREEVAFENGSEKKYNQHKQLDHIRAILPHRSGAGFFASRARCAVVSMHFFELWKTEKGYGYGFMSVCESVMIWLDCRGESNVGDVLETME